MSRYSFDAIAFAGGGNRCYWQGGFWDAFTAIRPQNPSLVVGVSAGAFQACFSLIGEGDRVRSIVLEACTSIERELDWGRLLKGRSPFVVADLYRDLIATVFGPLELAALRAAPEILIQVTHPPRWMPAMVAAYAAIGAYQVEKVVLGAAHSRAGRHVGLTAGHVSTHQLETPEALVEALMGTAAVPPFMPVGRIDGRPALDGGLVDNPPIDRIAMVEAKGGRTLVLTTRAGKTIPATETRTVVQPSVPIVTSRFAVTDGEAIRAANELGLKDGEAFARSL
ncbi:patatin-like phospholipase family protein [Phreatobacter oligotrophus]|uniref:patatin-like phospholipase family protein n=1 Tax=Phreatobacter oligotrophus TaxID=1122261 RepID=UPI002354F1F3|nr:patatin-like phospholipase family protein [Phreatobacter oligotrophus]MBX9989219.1 patatin-like phospholipase family protein [Phreatobacter oligotrophus]